MLSTETPEISVVIPVRNGADSLPALLTSLEQQTLEHDRFEVIVVDNASSDDTPAIARGYGCTVVEEPVPNRALARNRGARAARAPFYASTDADCVAHPEWLEALLKCAPMAPLVAGAVELRTREHPNAIERFEAIWRFGQESWVSQHGWAATANLMVHADAFWAVGGFDPTLRRYGEDADFCLRAGEAGSSIAFCAGAVVEHVAERELLPFLRRFVEHGYGANQAFYHSGAGRRAWREPAPALIGDRALRQIGHSPEHFEPSEWRRMARIARAGYAARMAGSLWAELARAR